MTPAKRTSLLIRLVCVVATILWIVLAQSARIQPLELRARDSELAIATGPNPNPNIVIIAFDEKAIHQYGPPVWPPALAARLIDAIDRLQPKVIGLDFFYAGEGGEDPHRLDSLRDSARNSGKVLGGMFFDEHQRAKGTTSVRADLPSWLRSQSIPYDHIGYRGTPNLDFLDAVDDAHVNAQPVSEAMRAYGHLNLKPGADQSIRFMPLIYRGLRPAAVNADEASKAGDDTDSKYGKLGDLYPSFDLRAASLFLDGAAITVEISDGRVLDIVLGDKLIPTDDTGQLQLHYSDIFKRYPTYSAADVMDGKLAADSLRGKIVLVGTTAAATGDLWGTPITGLMPGVEIHANAIGNMLDGNFFVQNVSTDFYGRIGLIGLGLLGFFLLPHAAHFGVQRTVIVTAIVMALLLVGHYAIMTRALYALPLIAPVFLLLSMVGGALIIGYFSEEKQRQQVERSFRHYLDPGVISELMDHPERLRLGGERRDLSVLFCDIRNFTTLAEGVEPETTVRMLNEFFTTMSDVVFAHGGLVDKFVGDQIMAFWGAPIARREHALLACRTALHIRDKYQDLRKHWLQEATQQPKSGVADGLVKGWVNCGVGVNTGSMVVGNIGSSRRFSYTVIGDTVNVASRLESLNKVYGTTVLIGPGTLAQLGDNFWYREVDAVRVKGRSQVMPVYELLAEKPAAVDHDWLSIFQQGLEAMRKRDWATSDARFAAALERNPADACAAFLRRRLAQIVVNPKLAEELLSL